LRGIIRHFHSTKSFTIPFTGITPTDEKLTFGLASAALVLTF
jgi:hypothetical protein